MACYAVDYVCQGKDGSYSSNDRQEKGKKSNGMPTACYSRHCMQWKRHLSHLVVTMRNERNLDRSPRSQRKHRSMRNMVAGSHF